ncbi:sarcosine oxidase subunit gamma [Amycolatopsis benzoatilytica]|uniref:sarcosine oxidase subunit gamma n=1 Tax=Amycolatopsis benzoatilytica TaxID=346045 RepID=UPI00037914E3|nr:sarcosine oxidase subunit gamma family protein [Amycolatopsis benzoatilytica]
MTVETRAPLAECADRLAALAPAVLAAERPFLSQLNLRIREGDVTGVLGAGLPQPCRFTSGIGDVLWLGPDEYLVLGAPEGTEAALREAITVGAVTDVSAQRTTVRLAGPAARDVLAHGCSIDLHPKAAPPGTCVQTLFARTGIVLLVREAGEFTVLVRQSFAPYFAAWLADAAVEYCEEES